MWSGPADSMTTTKSVRRYLGSTSDLVADDTNERTDGFVRDLTKGTTRWVTVGDAGQQGNELSGYPVLGDDADHVAFTSQATNRCPATRTASRTCSWRTCSGNPSPFAAYGNGRFV